MSGIKKWSPDLPEKMLQKMKEGATFYEACEMVGITTATFYNNARRSQLLELKAARAEYKAGKKIKKEYKSEVISGLTVGISAKEPTPPAPKPHAWASDIKEEITHPVGLPSHVAIEPEEELNDIPHAIEAVGAADRARRNVKNMLPVVAKKIREAMALGMYHATVVFDDLTPNETLEVLRDKLFDKGYPKILIGNYPPQLKIFFKIQKEERQNLALYLKPAEPAPAQNDTPTISLKLGTK